MHIGCHHRTVVETSQIITVAPASHLARRVIGAKARRAGMHRRGVHTDMRRQVAAKVVSVRSSRCKRNVGDGGNILAQGIPFHALQLVVTSGGAAAAAAAAAIATRNVLAGVTLGLDAPRLASVPNVLPVARNSTLGLLHLTRIFAIRERPLGGLDGQTPMLGRPRAGDLHPMDSVRRADQKKERKALDDGRAEASHRPHYISLRLFDPAAQNFVI